MPKFIVRVHCTESFDTPVEIDDNDIDPEIVEGYGIKEARKDLAAEVAERVLADASFEEQNKWFVACEEREAVDVKELEDFVDGSSI